jgi:G3E family GTPase
MVKIDLISGFLGVGKTTFANMLLRYYIDHGKKPVYIVNEFGQTGLDADIIKTDGFEAVEIFGGCICCTLKNDTIIAIEKVINTFSPDNIVFEPSGVFIFDSFFEVLNHETIKDKCELGNVFTIVDSVNFTFSKAVYGNFIYNQIKNSKVILLSKLEKTKNDVDEIICDIKNISPDAFIMSKIWKDWDTADFELLLSQEKPLRLHHHAHHHSELRSVTVKPEKPFTQDKIDSFIASCKSGVFGDLCRVKGILMTEDGPVLLNIAVQDVTLTAFKTLAEPTLTLIGNTVNEEEIVKFLNM